MTSRPWGHKMRRYIKMAYNILKEMKDPNTGKQSYVLLTDGLSQIWEIETEKEAASLLGLGITT